METIITKIIICSGVLLALYYLFLAKEKTLVFNRFYLIFSLVFSICIPFFTIERPQPEEKAEIIFTPETSEQIMIQQPQTEQVYDFSDLVLFMYLAVASLFLVKFVYSFIKIKTLKGRKAIYKSRKVFLLEKDLAPFSFWNTIYVSGKDFKNEEINQNIFLHEDVHIKQKHSLDLLFTEFLKIVFWFNPFIYFYKKAIITNHEFLADEGVIQQNRNIKTYQELILNEILKQQNPALVHPFNFKNTKKRFIMMTKQNSKFAKTKMVLVIPVLAIAGFVFAERTYKTNDLQQVAPEKNIISLTVSDDPYTLYNDIIKKYGNLLEQKRYGEFHKAVSLSDRAKLKELYFQLTKEQRAATPLFFINSPNKLAKTKVTQSEMNDFMNSKKYGLWIDGKKTKNQQLKNFKPEDFSNHFVSKRYRNAISKKNPEPFQLDMMTNKYYQEYLKEEEAVFMSFKTKGVIVGKDTIRPKNNVQSKQKITKTARTEAVDHASNGDDGKIVSLPEYPGGANRLRSLVASNFNGAIMKGDEGTVKAVAYFTVDENGKAGNVDVEGSNQKFNDEVGRVIKIANQDVTWKPSEKDGNPVKYRFKMPLTMQFESAKPMK